MNRTPVADWQQLSALYEAADALDPGALAAWLAQLRAQPHPLLAQLEQMLAARAQVQHNGFLSTLPRLPVPAEPPQPTAWAEGSRIGPYRLVRHLGEGGMAEVWMAQRDDGAFQRTVAIKLLFRHAGSTQRDSFAQRFTRERDILASLDHPHIAGLHDAGVTPAGQPWLALEYVEGQTLTRWCDTQRLSVDARVHLFRQVLLAVQHAHANLVIHRDLKPGNILVTTQGEVRLLDFGIAKLMEADGGALAETELTRMAGRPMTPNYAAPEQLLGQPLTTACDVYALGVVLYELLCGERPYELKLASAAQLEQSILEVEPRGPSRRALTEAVVEARGTTSVALRKTLSSDLDAIVLRALAKQPSERYGSVEAFRADLDHWLAGEPVEARAPSAAYRVSKFVGRHRWAVALSAGAVLSLIGVTVVAVVMGLQAREDSARAGAARDFMLNIFARANQEKSRGADITARDLLETGRKDVLTRLAGQPKLQAELLRGIAKIQSDMGEYASADGTYAELVRLYARLREPRQEAWARADHADNAYQMGDPSLAATLLQQAKDVSGRPIQDAELNARFSELDGWLALNRGDAASGRELLRVARQRSTELLGASHLRTFRLGQALLRVEGQLRDFDGAHALHAQLRQVAGQVKGLGAVDVATMDWEQVRLLQDAGHFAQALALADSVLPACTDSLGADEQVCRMLFLMRGSILLRLGFVERASSDLPRFAALAADQSWPYVRVEAMLMQFRLLTRTASSVDRQPIAERVRTFGQSGPEVPMNVVFKATALLALAESSLFDGDALGAQNWVEQAFAKLDAGVTPSRNVKFAALAGELMGIAQLHQGKPTSALDSLAHALSNLEIILGNDHAMTRLMALNSALALDALGRSDEALAIVADAEPILQSAFGPTAPAFQRVKVLRQRLELRVTQMGGVLSSPRLPQGTPSPSAGSSDFFS
jgi:serine/threonine protein kinase